MLLSTPVRLKALKPKGPEITPQNLGEHIKLRRLELGLRQVDAAQQIGVDVFTLRAWEKGKAEPMVQHYPAIMEFLGYCPYQRADTLAKQILFHRMHRGFSHRALAKAISVDPASISRWETGERRPFKRMVRRLNQLFGIDL